MASRMILNETSFFGWNAREVLVDEICKRGFKNALLVTDETLLGNGVTEKITVLLDKANITYHVYSEVKPNPTIINVKRGLKIVNKYHCDYIIAVGGGSVIDTAKAIGIVYTNPEFNDIKSLEGVADTKNKSLPIIAIPTTSGTAAEVTINYVITNEDDKVKMVCVDPNDIPLVSIVDSELMAAMPATVAAATGLDALTHAIEGYITKGAWDMTKFLSLKAVEMIYKNLELAVNKDKNAIDQMAMAQYIAGMGFSNAGLGIIHSMAHQLGAMYDTPHGVANALLLPYVLEYNGVVCPNDFKDIAIAMGIDVAKLSDQEVLDSVVDAIRKLSLRLNIPQHISDIGGNKKDIDKLAEKALADPCTPGNPREVTLDDFKELFNKAF